MSQIKGLISPILERWRMKKSAKFIKNGTAVLDIGCGAGNILKCINPEYYLGIDTAEDCINEAKEKWLAAEYTIEFKKIDIAPFETTNKFDYILMLAILEHLKNPEQVLIKLKQFLHSRGVIIITTPGPTAEIIHKIGSKIGLFDKDAEAEHNVIFNKEMLYSLAEKTGLNIVHYSSFEFGLNNIIVMKQ